MVPDAELTARTAARPAAGPAVALRMAKQARNANALNDLQQQLALEAKLQGEAGKTGDSIKGINVFLQKRTPKFGGC